VADAAAARAARRDRRHDAIATLLAGRPDALRDALRHGADVERIGARIALRQARPRELAGLRATLVALPQVHAALPAEGSVLLDMLGEAIAPPAGIVRLLGQIADESAALLAERRHRCPPRRRARRLRAIGRGSDAYHRLEAKGARAPASRRVSSTASTASSSRSRSRRRSARPAFRRARR
jgi:hypothetical protein